MPKKPKKYEPLIGEDGEVRPLRKSDKIKVSWLRDSFPELAEYSREREQTLARQRGRPKKVAPKKLQSFKLSPDVIDAIRGSGPGYNARVEAVLRAALEQGTL